MEFTLTESEEKTLPPWQSRDRMKLRQPVLDQVGRTATYTGNPER